MSALGGVSKLVLRSTKIFNHLRVNMYCFCGFKGKQISTTYI